MIDWEDVYNRIYTKHIYTLIVGTQTTELKMGKIFEKIPNSANKYIKLCSILLAIKKTSIKTIITYHYIPSRKDKIKKTETIKHQ